MFRWLSAERGSRVDGVGGGDVDEGESRVDPSSLSSFLFRALSLRCCFWPSAGWMLFQRQQCVAMSEIGAL